MPLRLLLFISLTLWISIARAQDNPRGDSLERALALEKDPLQKTMIYNDLARACMAIDLEKANRVALEGIEYARKNQLTESLGHLYCTEGVVRFSLGDKEGAFTYTDSSQTLFTNLGNKKGVANAVGNKGIFYFYTGQYERCLNNHYQSLSINEELNNKNGIAADLNNILTVLFIQEDFDAALEIGRRAYSMFSSLGDEESVALITYNISSIYMKKGQADSASFYANLSIDLNKKHHQFGGLADGLRLKAEIAIKEGKYEDGIAYSKEAMAISDSVGNPLKKIESMENLVNILFLTKDFAEGLPIAEEALRMSREAGVRPFERDALLWLMKYHSAMGNFRQAYAYSEEYIPLKDAILNETNMQQIGELRTKYETEKKEKENDYLKETGALQVAEISRKQYFIYALGGILVLVVFISFLIMRQNKILARQRTIELEQRLLRSQMNPHFLFNALIAIQSYVYKSDPAESGRYISSFAKLMRAILENSRKEYITLTKEIQWLENYLELQLLRFEKKFTYTLEIDPSLEKDIVEIPPMLTQPFIENALEHGLRDLSYPGILKVCFKIQGDFLRIEVEDNGVGIGTISATDSTEKKSLATVITKERIHFLNKGKSMKISFDVTNINPTGTLVSFDIPLQ